jgi:2-polyprenyl-3-methyl-5-hydroxy-6-metoxy-1,4-benzoquinol methylase
MQSVNAIQDFLVATVKPLVMMFVQEITRSVALRMLMVLSNMAVTLEVDATTRNKEKNIRPLAIALSRVLAHQPAHVNVRERTSVNLPVNV